MYHLHINFSPSHLTPKLYSWNQATRMTCMPGTKQTPIRRHRTQTMTFIAKMFYDLRATTLEGDSVDFNVYRGRVVLIENVASLWGTTTRDYSQLNQLQSRYPHRLVVLAFPCNQFGYQVSGTSNSPCIQNWKICWIGVIGQLGHNAVPARFEASVVY